MVTSFRYLEMRGICESRMETTADYNRDFLHWWPISFIGLAIMILTGMTSIGAIWEIFKLCPLCM